MQETITQIEHKINHVIGLKHTLELVEPLQAVLSAGAESRLLLQILELLRDPAYIEMLNKVQKIISNDARALKVS